MVNNSTKERLINSLSKRRPDVLQTCRDFVYRSLRAWNGSHTPIVRHHLLSRLPDESRRDSPGCAFALSARRVMSGGMAKVRRWKHNELRKFLARSSQESHE